MRVTGIVSRVDNLGRVVIHKQIRRALEIKEGDPLEIFITDENGILFQKYDADCSEDASVIDDYVYISRKELSELIKQKENNF